MSKRVTMADIAAASGSSAMTVSRVLRHEPNVNVQTRERIMKAAEELGYWRDTRQGRPAVEQACRAVCQIVVGSLGNQATLFHLRLLMAMERELSDRGFDCLVRFSNGKYEVFARVLEAVRQTSADVTVAIGDFPEAQMRSLQCAKPGLLLLDNPGIGTNDTGFSTISFDNREAAHLGVSHLLSRGRRHIMLLTGTEKYCFAREIQSGYREALERAGIAYDPQLVIRCDFMPRSAMVALQQKLTQQVAFDAIFTNDEMAAAAYHVLAGAQRRIPEDVAICGCDNIPSGEQLFPELTTISLSYESLAQQAAELIGSGGLNRPCRIRLFPELVIRRSS